VNDNVKTTVRGGAVGAVVGGVMGGMRASRDFDYEFMRAATDGATKAAQLGAMLDGRKVRIAKEAAVSALLGSAVFSAPLGLALFLADRLKPAPAPGSPMSDAEKKVDSLRLKMAQIAQKALWRTMGRPGDVPWWFKDARIAQDRDGNYFLKGIISDKLPMDDTGWPYGLPQTSEGVKVVAEREHPGSLEPVKLGPT